MEITKEQKYTVEWCASCGTPVFMGVEVHRDREKSGDPFYCINGHGNTIEPEPEKIGTGPDGLQPCPVCGKRFKRVKMHISQAHSRVGRRKWKLAARRREAAKRANRSVKKSKRGAR